MSFYTDLREVATDLLTEFGVAVTVKVPSSSSTDSNLVKTVTYSDVAAHAVLQGRVRERLADGSWAWSDRFSAVVSVENSLDLTVGCRLVIGGTTYRLARVTRVAPDFSTLLVYRVEYEL